jgi:DNA topoisomerase-3
MKRLDVNRIISACDYDREGQIIGDIIFKVLKPSQPVYRLLLNEWTQSAVIEGLNNLKSNEQMIPLRDSGVSRQWADWVIGINLTAVTTLKLSRARKVLNIGRVILPTLKIVYDRDQEIKHFTPEKYYKLGALFIKGADVYEGIYYEKKDKFKSKDYLDDILEKIKSVDPYKGVVTKKDVKRKKEYPPYLFNLSSLQGFITSRNRGWSASKVLKVAQSLYEKKLITYPRTSSIALEESLIGKTKKTLEVHKKGLPYEDQIEFKVTKRIFDNKKVSSHSAIIPTYVLPKKLSNDELTVYYAIKNRFLKQFLPLAEYDETKIVTSIGDYPFHSSGKVEIVKGWRVVEQKEKKDRLLPNLELGEQLPIRAVNVTSHETKPPKHHNEKTLLRIMETCGKQYKEDQTDEMIEKVLSGFSIGTAATRAETISKLIRIGYIERDQSYLKATELGCKLVETFPIQVLFDLEYTGRIEKKLEDISKGLDTRNHFLHQIFDFVRESVEQIKTHEEILVEKEEQVFLGHCPACHGKVVETSKSFGCNNWKNGCKFVIWKNDKFFASMKKKPTKTMTKALLKDGRAFVKGFVGKNGQKFNAYVKYEKKEDSEFYQWKLEFK